MISHKIIWPLFFAHPIQSNASSVYVIMVLSWTLIPLTKTKGDIKSHYHVNTISHDPLFVMVYRPCSVYTFLGYSNISSIKHQNEHEP